MKDWFFIFITFSSHMLNCNINLSDYNEWNIPQFAAKILPKNPVIVLAGGAEGHWLIQFAHTFSEGQIHVFEPNPHAFSLLQNIKGYFTNVEIFPFALNDLTREVPFFFSERTGSLFEAHKEWKWFYKEIEKQAAGKNLEEWATEHQISQIDFLFLNVGGAEGFILKSIPNLLNNVKMLFIETQDQQFRENTLLFPELKSFLVQYGFEEIFHWKINHFQGYAVFAKCGEVF